MCNIYYFTFRISYNRKSLNQKVLQSLIKAYIFIEIKVFFALIKAYILIEIKIYSFTVINKTGTSHTFTHCSCTNTLAPLLHWPHILSLFTLFYIFTHCSHISTLTHIYTLLAHSHTFTVHSLAAYTHALPTHYTHTHIHTLLTY